MNNNQQVVKKLSLPRLGLTIIVLIGLIYALFLGWNKITSSRVMGSFNPWFAPYVDVTATPHYSFEQISENSSAKNVVLAFIVSSKEDACTPSWGGFYTMDKAGKELDLDRRIARYRKSEGNISISFGGLLNDELSVNCTDSNKLTQAYMDVIKRYEVDTLDFDIEGKDLKNKDALKRRFKVLSKIQKDIRSQNKELAIWLTLPVSPNGLSRDGTNAVSEALKAGVDLAGVNVMTMDYGSSKEKNQSMHEASMQALNETHRQVSVIFKKAGINLDSSSVWAKIGATPMIGQSDVQEEVFTLEDARKFNEFVVSTGLARLSIWSANRDIQCGENYVNIAVVSDSCSGIKQEKQEFSTLLGKGFDGKISANASLTTKEDPKDELRVDDPKKSPYQIWKEKGVYLEGTKVVWRHNVYEAKWWTKGDLPDDPVLQAWETPWKLVGPVLPGEKPIPQPTLPEGTYPNWSGTDEYEALQIVLFDKVPYQAKWWTQGDSPAAAASGPDSSPWVPLTQEEVNEIIKNLGISN